MEAAPRQVPLEEPVACRLLRERRPALGGTLPRALRTGLSMLLTFLPTTALAESNAVLAHGVGSGYSTSSTTYSGATVRNLRVQYEYCPGILAAGGGECGPPACGANPYRLKATLYLNGTSITEQQYQTASAWAAFTFSNVSMKPGTYTAVVVLERLKPTCLGWETVETLTTNSFNARP